MIVFSVWLMFLANHNKCLKLVNEFKKQEGKCMTDFKMKGLQLRGDLQLEVLRKLQAEIQKAMLRSVTKTQGMVDLWTQGQMPQAEQALLQIYLLSQ